MAPHLIAAFASGMVVGMTVGIHLTGNVLERKLRRAAC
jgi:hypothetical protein